MSREAKFPSLIDSSMLSSAGCARKFFFQYCLNLAAGETSVHLHAGKVLARAVQEVRNCFYKEGMSEKDSLYAGFECFIGEWGDYESPQFGSGKFKDFINMANALVSYFRQYPLETDEIQPLRKADGSPAVEFTFAIPLPIQHPDSGDPIFYGGRADMVGVWNGMNAIVDEKTTYTFPESWIKQFTMRGQFIGYCWAGQQSGMETNCAVVRGIGVQQSGIKHQEAKLLFPQWQIDRWYEQMIRKVQHLVEEYRNYKATQDLDSLSMSYGNECSSYSGCEMMDLCTSENPESWFDSYGERNWDPLA
jgi:hypothetical protein